MLLAETYRCSVELASENVVAVTEIAVEMGVQWCAVVLRQLSDVLEMIRKLTDAKKLEPLLTLHLKEK